MNFTLVLEVSRNGRPHEYHLDSKESIRPDAERAIRMFRAGELPMESTVTFGEVTLDGQRTDDLALRWADVRDIRIEGN